MDAKHLIELRDLEKQHAELLTKAGQAPAFSADRERFLCEADRVERRINDIHEEANPTPLA